MKARTILTLCACLALASVPAETLAAKVMWYQFPALVNESSLIVTGTITIRAEQPILLVEEALKGKTCDELTIQQRSLGEVPSASFQEGESVLLFLETPDDDCAAALVGYGDQAKWPKLDVAERYFHYPKGQANASLEEVEEMARRLLRIESSRDLEQRIDMIAGLMKSSDLLLQLTALQYVLGDHLWIEKDHPERSSHEIAREQFDVLRRLSDYAVRLSNSKDSSIRAESIRLLRYARPNVAIPKLISRIPDTDPGVRAATHSVLGTLSIELKAEEGLEYSLSGSEEHLRSAQNIWNDWWLENESRIESMIE